MFVAWLTTLLRIYAACHTVSPHYGLGSQAYLLIERAFSMKDLFVLLANPFGCGLYDKLMESLILIFSNPVVNEINSGAFSLCTLLLLCLASLSIHATELYKIAAASPFLCSSSTLM